MRLLQVDSNGHYGLTADFLTPQDIPQYAILSHTWGAEEVIYPDLSKRPCDWQNKSGFKKIKFCAEQAKRDGLHYFWVDTCCIDKSDSAVLQTAINSMFRWYRDAERCYVYLSDVSIPEGSAHVSVAKETALLHESPILEKAFRDSKWFTRGWTLQELIAPKTVDFYSREGIQVGDKRSLEPLIHDITGIPAGALRGAPLSNFTVAEIEAWARNRQTTHVEDMAYCLLGIFGIFKSLRYGEGREEAMKRVIAKANKRWQSEQQQQQPSPQSKRPYYIQLPQNEKFTGRTDVLEAVKDTLFVRKDSQKAALVGLGGVGKTQIALKFIYETKTDRPEYSVFWVPMISLQAFEQAYTKVAEQLGIEKRSDGDDIKERVCDYLSSPKAGRWMLVIDNADDGELLYGANGKGGLNDFLPISELGIVLMTTRSKQVAIRFAARNVISITAMSPPEAMKLLEESIYERALLRDETPVAELLLHLTYLPLAITQAAAYINQSGTSVTKYLGLLRGAESEASKLLERDLGDDTRYQASRNAVASTLIISFEQIQKLNKKATDLLEFISCIEPKSIPQSILPKSDGLEEQEWALGTLCSYAFLVRRGMSDMFDMHSLVHLAARTWVARKSYALEAKRRVLRHIDEVFPSIDYNNCRRWREYLPHATYVLQDKTIPKEEKTYSLGSSIGACLEVDGRVREAVDWLQTTERWMAKTLAEGNPSRLASQHSLAHGYWSNGQLKEAIKLFEHVVLVKNKMLAEEDLSRLYSEQVLASAYMADGQIKKASQLLESVVAVHEKTLEEDHYARLSSQQTLSGAYQANGQMEKCVKVLEHVVAVREKMMGPKYSEEAWLLVLKFCLGRAYHKNGQIKKAMDLLRYVVTLYEKTMAEEHPNRLESERYLASAYQANGQIEEAVDLLEHVVDMQEKTLTKKHHLLLESQGELADAYRASGRTKDAVGLLEYVVTASEEIQAADHPGRLRIQHFLASAYQADGQIKKAIELLEHVVAIRGKSLSEEHPDRLAAQHELSQLYVANRHDETLQHTVASNRSNSTVTVELLDAAFKHLAVSSGE